MESILSLKKHLVAQYRIQHKATIGLILLFSFFSLPNLTYGHGRLLQPAGRSSLWRFNEFAKYNPATNYDDNQLYCGGFVSQYERNGGKCGVCGDSWDQPQPRDNEDGGIYGKGIIAAHYSPGQIINVVVELTRSHLGYFRLRLCVRNDTSPLTQSCFNKNRLYFTDEKGTKMGSKYIVSEDRTGYYNATMVIPQVVGSRSVIQWHYRAGNTWGTCKNGTTRLGCGRQEIFRSCSDVSIG